MAKTRDKKQFQEIYDLYFDNVYRYIFLYVKRQEDSLDICQDVFFKFYTSPKMFDGNEHIKAWLLSCAYNSSMDFYRSKMRKNLSLDDIKENTKDFEIDETLGHILALPEKYKSVIYMHYYEGYKTHEIAKILRKPEATIRTQLKRGREILKEVLE